MRDEKLNQLQEALKNGQASLLFTDSEGRHVADASEIMVLVNEALQTRARLQASPSTQTRRVLMHDGRYVLIPA